MSRTAKTDIALKRTPACSRPRSCDEACDEALFTPLQPWRGQVLRSHLVAVRCEDDRSLGGEAEKRARARANGVAANERERQKHRRYTGQGLVAGALETGGRLGRELVALIKEHVLFSTVW